MSTLEQWLSDTADAIVSECLPEIKDGMSHQRTAAVAVSKLFRPYLEAACARQGVKLVRSIEDKRLRAWAVTFAVWSGDYLDCERLTVTEPVVFKGLDGAGDGVAKLLASFNVPEFAPAALRRTFNGLRSTLSRDRGTCDFQVKASGWWMGGKIRRVSETKS